MRIFSWNYREKINKKKILFCIWIKSRNILYVPTMNKNPIVPPGIPAIIGMFEEDEDAIKKNYVL